MAMEVVASFNDALLLSAARGGRNSIDYRARQTIYSQGDSADAAFYVVHGKVKLVVTSEQGKEAVIALAGAGELFGEICLVSSIRFATARCMTATRVSRVGKADMIRALHAQPGLAESFAYQLVKRINRAEADLAAHLVNSAEKRLARTLLSLANLDVNDMCNRHTTRIDQQTLADMVGTTRPRVNFFMKKFRKLGMVEYGADLKVHAELLGDFLQH